MFNEAIAKFDRALISIPFGEVNFGSGGLRVYRRDEVEAGQVGYGVAPDGSSLCSGEVGAWRPEWIVVGYDTASGDPLIMDTSDPALPILRDLNGRGKWDPEKISLSLDAFLAAYELLGRLAKGRATPVELETNPLSQGERAGFLAHISDLNNGQAGRDFWEALIEG